MLLEEAELRVALPAPPEWAVANAGGNGFYRVKYAPAMLRRMTKALSRIPPIERFNLVNDALALTQAGAMSAAEYLDLTGRFRDETDRNVWTALTGSFAYLSRLIAEGVRPGLEAWVRHRLEPAVERLGWERQPEETELTRQLRADLLRVLGTLGNDEETQRRARSLYEGYRSDETAVDPNLLPALISILAASGGEAEYDEFLQRFKSARTPQEEQRYLYALAAFRQPELVGRTLERTINGEVRSQDAPFLMRALLGGVYSRGLAWEFLGSVGRSGPRSGSVTGGCTSVTALVSAEWEQDVQTFFRSRGIVLGGKTIEQYLEQLRVAVRFQEREAAALAALLARTPR